METTELIENVCGLYLARENGERLILSYNAGTNKYSLWSYLLTPFGHDKNYLFEVSLEQARSIRNEGYATWNPIVPQELR